MASSAKASFSTAAIFPLIGNIITLTKKVNLSSSPHKKLTCTEGRERCPVQIPRPTLPFQSPHQSMSHIKCASLLRSGQRWIAIFWGCTCEFKNEREKEKVKLTTFSSFLQRIINRCVCGLSVLTHTLRDQVRGMVLMWGWFEQCSLPHHCNDNRLCGKRGGEEQQPPRGMPCSPD